MGYSEAYRHRDVPFARRGALTSAFPLRNRKIRSFTLEITGECVFLYRLQIRSACASVYYQLTFVTVS